MCHVVIANATPASASSSREGGTWTSYPRQRSVPGVATSPALHRKGKFPLKYTNRKPRTYECASFLYPRKLHFCVLAQPKRRGVNHLLERNFRVLVIFRCNGNAKAPCAMVADS